VTPHIYFKCENRVSLDVYKLVPNVNPLGLRDFDIDGTIPLFLQINFIIYLIEAREITILFSIPLTIYTRMEYVRYYRLYL
jgi:hypothetical protein